MNFYPVLFLLFKKKKTKKEKKKEPRNLVCSGILERQKFFRNNSTIDKEVQKAISVLSKQKDNPRKIAKIQYSNSTKTNAEGYISSDYFSSDIYSDSVYMNNRNGKNKPVLDGYQVGIEFSSVTNTIFFPMKQKKISAQLIDKGIMLDYLNTSPVLNYF